jgi:hypothetical protein
MPNAAVCRECGYSLRGLPDAVCPECGRRFDAGDPTTYRNAKAAPGVRLTPGLLGGTGVAIYVVWLLVLGSLEPGAVKSPLSVVAQPILMFAAGVFAIVVAIRAWRTPEARISGTLAAALLLLIILAVHLPLYLAMLGDIAAVQSESLQRSAGGS